MPTNEYAIVLKEYRNQERQAIVEFKLYIRDMCN